MRITLFLVFALTFFNTTIFAMDDAQIKQAVLASHNKYRAQHHAAKLIWDNELANYAEHYASKCVFQHSGGPYGENLAAGYSTASAAINRWYRENEEYSYRNPGFSKATGHFTQLVWRSTRKVGCGFVPCNGRNGTPGNYLVCEYSPAGNVVNDGYFEANVVPLG